MSRVRRLTVLTASAVPVLAAGLLAAGPLVGAAHAATSPYGTASNDSPAPCAAATTACPSGESFYTGVPAGGITGLADGAVVRSRPGVIAVTPPSLKTATTFVYRSTDTFGAPVLDSGTLLVPTAPYAGTGPQPIVSWQFPEDSVGAQCRPSYDLAHTGNNSNVDAEQGTINALLAQGIVVVAPDFEGPAETYEVGGQSGHAVLDGVRAAEQLLTTPAATTPVALNGYSGGAFATGWGAELATTYAPELHIVGTSMGGTPADQAVTGKYLDGTAFGGLALLTTIAQDRAFPALHIQDRLNAKGHQFFTDNQGSCVGQATAQSFARFDDYTTQPGLIDTPDFVATLRFNDLGLTDYPGERAPTFPVFNYHVVNDEIVPYNQDQVFIKALCTQGTPVQHTPLTGDHISGEAAGAPAVLAFLQARFNGAPFVSTCPAILAAPAVPQIPPITMGATAPTGPPGTTPSPAPSPSTTSTPPAEATSVAASLAASGTLASTGEWPALPALAATALAIAAHARRRSRRADR